MTALTPLDDAWWADLRELLLRVLARRAGRRDVEDLVHDVLARLLRVPRERLCAQGEQALWIAIRAAIRRSIDAHRGRDRERKRQAERIADLRASQRVRDLDVDPAAVDAFLAKAGRVLRKPRQLEVLREFLCTNLSKSGVARKLGISTSDLTRRLLAILRALGLWPKRGRPSAED